MRIVYTVPGLVPHGGIRVIFEHCNRLLDFGHEVFALFLTKGRPTWFDLDPRVRIVYNPYHLSNVDALVITSPHSIRMTEKIRARKVFLFCQMAEHLFKEGDDHWFNTCRRFYTAPYPMLSISQWNIDLFTAMGRTAETHYIGCGVNTDHFPISVKQKDGTRILVEGWQGNNPSKDVDYLGPKVALRLKEEFGVRVLAYSQVENLGPYKPDEYHYRPTLQVMNELYERATILIKATRYDARACAPMEAMTKGTVTARAIVKGDDDLIHDVNCLKSDYNEEELYNNARMLLKNTALRNHLAEGCCKYVKQYSWDYWMKKINAIYES